MLKKKRKKGKDHGYQEPTPKVRNMHACEEEEEEGREKTKTYSTISTSWISFSIAMIIL